MRSTAVFLLLLFSAGRLGLANARPPTMTQYFPPQYHPWAIDDIDIHDDDDLTRVLQSDEDRTFIQPAKLSSKYEALRDKPYVSEDVRSTVSDFSRFKGDGGYNPPGFADLNKVYWWEKRFNNNHIIAPSKDIPFFDDDDPNDIIMNKGFVKKRDYTAAQLVNMLKNLARARRHRVNHVVGKGLRFGISK
ncbi:uncharacterized protein LOC129223929 [Uloborus diversus]|uniref:uncharacterized protein LOC129223929 n=1 Tax=Uloborus diversus TaxID=327109 RepID=UPI00240A12DE|nr:uncharacterized protein LOC129223929 [Uloborus diversus]